MANVFLSASLQLLLDRLDFVRGYEIENGLKGLKETLTKVGACLNDAEDKQLDSEAVKRWLDELKDAVYDAEDLLDEIATEASRRKLEAESQTSTNQVWNLLDASPNPSYFSLESKLKTFTEGLDELALERSGLGLVETSAGSSSVVKETSSLVDESGVYGRDADKKKIIELLLRDEPKISVIPIVGMGGIGKTTLAQIVYNDQRLERHFNLKVWVCASEEFDVKRITKTILASVSSKASASDDLYQVQVELKAALSGKKFLIVLDDVLSTPNTYDWPSLKKAFEVGAPGSKIIVTTRNTDVASMMGTVENYYLEHLSNDDCWSVFVQDAFGNRDLDAKPNLVVIGKKIVEKCRGLPLAVKTIGGLLRHKQEEDEWEDILNSKIWDLPREGNDIPPALILSYHNLPSHLKQCSFTAFDEVKSLRTFRGPMTPKGSYLTTYVTVRSLKCLSMLSLKGCHITELPDSIGGMKSLRYLNLSHTGIKSLPESTSTLFNLQTLRLKNCFSLKKLPTGMRNLINLLHLDITHSDSIEGIPPGVGKLNGLHKLSDFIVGSTSGSGIGQLMNLNNLRGTLRISRLENVIHSSYARMANLKNKQKLNVLTMVWSSEFDSRKGGVEEEVLDTLQPHKKLKELSIKCYGGIKFPTWLGDPSFSSMVSLRLEDCVKCTSLPPLGQLPSLKDLYIIRMHGVKCVGLEFYGEGFPQIFPSLETLRFENMEEWEKWLPRGVDRQVELFPCLRELSIIGCTKLLGRLPDHLASLEKLIIHRCQKLVVTVSNLPKLYKLHIQGCQEVVQTSMVDLSSLKSVVLSNISNLMCLTEGFVQVLTKLEDLVIVGCNELRSLWQKEVGLQQYLTSLYHLKIEGCPNLHSLLVEDAEQ